MLRKIFVVAGDYSQYDFFIKEFKKEAYPDNVKGIYISSPEILLGYVNRDVYIVGTATERADFVKILDELKAREFKIFRRD
jgi:hypothetical protein